jgi:hypothetical protein
MSPDDGNISSPATLSSPHFVTVRNGHIVSITSSGHTSVRTPLGHTFKLNHVLLVPTLIRNFLSVRKFTRDNCCSIEFDAFGFSVKDLKTRRVILRCNSVGELYTFPGTASARRSLHTAFVATATSKLWHWWLGVDDVNDRPVGNTKRRCDEYSTKFSLSYETKVYQSSRKKTNI